MRRGLASLIMGLSLLVASASWAGFVMSHTVLDPGRSERLADHLLDDPEVRAAIVDRIADSLQTQIPKGVPIPRQSLEAAAGLALDDPRVEALVRDGIVRAHQNALNGIDEPIMLDATVLGDAARAALVSSVPTLDAVLPAAPQLAVEVPSTGLSWLGTVKDFVDRFTVLGALVALAGLLLSFLVTTNRPAVLRRVSYWGFGASAFWLAAAYGLPALVGFVMPSAMAIASAVVDVFAGAMIRPALTMAAVSVALLATSVIWPARQRRRPAAMLDRASRDRATSRQPSGGRGGRGRAGGDYPIPAAAPASSYPSYPSTGSAPGFGAGQPTAAPSYPDPGYAAAPTYPQPDYAPAPASAGYGPGPDPTMEYPVISSAAGPAFGAEPATAPLWPAATTPPAAEAPTATTPDAGGGVWVAGVGYIDPSTPAADPYGTAPATYAAAADPYGTAPDPYGTALAASDSYNTAPAASDPSEDPTISSPLADRPTRR